jgi:hypothetical protein
MLIARAQKQGQKITKFPRGRPDQKLSQKLWGMSDRREGQERESQLSDDVEVRLLIHKLIYHAFDAYLSV